MNEYTILVCPVSGRQCERNCEESPENPLFAGLCERLGFAPMKGVNDVNYLVMVDEIPWQDLDGVDRWDRAGAEETADSLRMKGYANVRIERA